MADRVITPDDLDEWLEPFDRPPDVLDGADPFLQFSEDLIRLCARRRHVTLGVAALVLARAHRAGQVEAALHALLADPAMVRLLEREGGGV